ncbi:hypothetical protein [Lacticaseibacillus manihotivorans]|nr:hypothetical protein [Lacticaseibacillus manihotivorans]
MPDLTKLGAGDTVQGEAVIGDTVSAGENVKGLGIAVFDDAHAAIF